MAFEGLTEKISATFKKLRGKGRLKEADVKEAMREIRMALLEADVSYKVTKDFVKQVTERCVGTDVLESLTPAHTAALIRNWGAEKVLFGSDYPMWSQEEDLRVFFEMGLTETENHLILSENAKRVFSIR